MRFLVRILPGNGDWSAFVPDLPGCVAAGDTIEEVRDLIAEAIELHLEMMQKKGEGVPLKLEDLEDGELCAWVEIKEPQPA